MWRSWISPSIAALVLAALAVLAVREFTREPPPNVIVLTVESWRADAATQQDMPNLFAAANSGVRFDNHRAVSAWTAPNVIGVLSGVSPFEQGVHARGHSLPSRIDAFTERVARAGWEVAGLQAFMLIELFGNLGLSVQTGLEPKTWLASRARARTPFFLWYHYLQTHLPYDPAPTSIDVRTFQELGPGAREREAAVRKLPAIPDGSVDFLDSDSPWVRELYLGGVREFDAWFGSFWTFFEASGLRESTILIVTADHGEELLDRGRVGHASTTRAGHLHEEVVRVPLFVWAPERLLPVAPGSRVSHPTDHLMIAPALARMLGLREESDLDLWRADPAYVWRGLTSFGGFSEPDPDSVSRFVGAALEGSLKVQIETDAGRISSVETWDLSDDPAERRPIRPIPDRVRPLVESLVASIPEQVKPGGRVAAPGTSVAGEVPDWIRPVASGPIGYGDISKMPYVSWTGDPAGKYVLQYEAGSGFLRLTGEIEVAGPRYEVGAITEGYWNTWVVPYERVRLRVRPLDTEDAWSEWVEMELTR